MQKLKLFLMLSIFVLFAHWYFAIQSNLSRAGIDNVKLVSILNRGKFDYQSKLCNILRCFFLRTTIICPQCQTEIQRTKVRCLSVIKEETYFFFLGAARSRFQK
jgi:predicted amidophosphoribosyltransferase